MRPARTVPFPTAQQLWQGVVLCSIANAMAQTDLGPAFGGRTWNGTHYWVNNDQGTYGVLGFADPIAFRDPTMVGLLCDLHSERAGWEDGQPPDWQRWLVGMPAGLRAWAERDLLDYVRQTFSEAGERSPIPTITAAFWSVGEWVEAVEPWGMVIQHGAHVLETELMDLDDAIVELEDDGLIDEDEMVLLRELYERKMADPGQPVVLGPRDMQILTGGWATGLRDTRETLAAIGIFLP